MMRCPRSDRNAATLALALLALLATQCSFFGNASEPESEPLSPAELTLITFEQGSHFARAEIEAFERFHEEFPQIEIVRRSYSSAPQSYLTSSTPPELLAESDIYFLHESIAKDQLTDLSDVWLDNDLVEGYPDAFQQATQKDGKQYYLPIGYAWAGFFYNRVVFDELDLTPPETWSELTLLCETLRDRGIAPFALSGDDAVMGMLWFSYLNMRLNGPDFHRALLRGEMPFTDGRVQAALEAWQDLQDRDCFVERPSVMSDFDAVAALIDHEDLPGEKAAMALAASYHIDKLPPLFQNQLGFFPFPTLDETVPIGEVVDSYGYSVPANSANQRQTLALLRYMSSPETQTRMAQVTGAIAFAPIHLDVDRDVLGAKVVEGIALAESADAVVPGFLLTFPDSMWGNIYVAYEQYVRGAGSLQDFVARLEEGRQETLDAGEFLDRQ